MNYFLVLCEYHLLTKIKTMSALKERLKELLYDFTRGIGVNKKTINEFKNEKGKLLPIRWNTTYRILRDHKYEPSFRTARKLLEYFKEPHTIKDGIISLGEKTGDDE